MRPITYIFALLFLFTSASPAQYDWTPPHALTSGLYDDGSPAFESRISSTYEGEWMAFVRRDSVARTIGICAMQISSFGGPEIDSVIVITSDPAAVDDAPAIARGEMGRMIVWHRRAGGRDNIWYALDSAGIWSPPRPLTDDSVGSSHPQIFPGDSVIGAVFERGGRIAFAEYTSGAWSGVHYLTPPGDTLNDNPQILYPGFYFSNPMVVWEHVKAPDTARSLFYSVRTDSGWSPPDTVTAVGDNRHPRFIKAGFLSGTTLTWESDRSGRWEIYADYADNFSHWGNLDEVIVPSDGVDHRNGTFMIVPLITMKTRTSRNGYWFDAGVWRSGSRGNDTIVSESSTSLLRYASLPAGAVPDISCGIDGYSGLHVWCAWEAQDSGRSRIMATSTNILLGVGDAAVVPHGFKLLQNYPNPFNPTTYIPYEIPGSPHPTHVTFVISDVLGRTVRVMEIPVQSNGSHTITWNGLDDRGRLVSSGTYYGRLTFGSLQGTVKMLMLR